MHPVRMIMRRFADFGQPQPAVEGILGDAPRAIPHIGLFHHIADSVTGEGELARQMTV